jgi:hypothetical protein
MVRKIKFLNKLRWLGKGLSDPLNFESTLVLISAWRNKVNPRKISGRTELARYSVERWKARKWGGLHFSSLRQRILWERFLFFRFYPGPSYFFLGLNALVPSHVAGSSQGAGRTVSTPFPTLHPGNPQDPAVKHLLCPEPPRALSDLPKVLLLLSLLFCILYYTQWP